MDVHDTPRTLAQLEQRAIDVEMRVTRRVLLNRLRRWMRSDPQALCGEEFLSVADVPVVLDAILMAATTVGAADACVLQFYDQRTSRLTLVRHRGLTPEFLSYFAVVESGQPTACATAAAAGKPVIVDDVSQSPIFTGQPSLRVVLAAGSRAIHSYPLLRGKGTLMGVLSFHYRTVRPPRGNRELVAWCASRALERVVFR